MFRPVFRTTPADFVRHPSSWKEGIFFCHPVILIIFLVTRS